MPGNLRIDYIRVSENISSHGCYNAGVYIVKRVRDGKTHVEKRLRPEEIRNGGAEFEINLMRDLNHRNITRYVDAFIDNGNCPGASLYLEFADLGTLEGFFESHEKKKERISETLVWAMLKQLASALSYIQWGIIDAFSGEHARPGWRGVVHRDLYPANILLYSGSHGSPNHRLCISDFGMAFHYDDELFEERCLVRGNADWVPPESPIFGFPSDIWGVGAIIQAACRLGSDIYRVRSFQGTGRFYSPQLAEAIHMLMCTNADDRPSHIYRYARNLQGMEDQASEDFRQLLDHSFGHARLDNDGSFS
ncbi:hypothetical protein MMC12_001010 [Toensbergia leucococca]|nr:hypothetical protein [Toensbergia leucococca]